MSVSIKKLHIEYPDQLVFDEVNLDVRDDEIVAIQTDVLDGGTSLLKGVAGYLKGVGGSVELEGVNLLASPPDAILYKIGYVYEDHGLVSLYSVLQNVGLPLQFHSDLTGDEIYTAVEQTCEDLGIDKALYDLRPHRLNDVQTRLVNLARALVTRPRLLLIDELEGGMSDELLQATMNTLRQYQQQNPMAIIVTTSSEVVMECADRIYAIENYTLIEQPGVARSR
ncbi:MAG: ATP-binding cassette domain-containing protein [Pseudomonadales bacterium]